MSYFLFLALPERGNILKHVPQGFDMEDASKWPLGKTTLGNRKKGQVYCVTGRSYSMDLVGGSNRRHDRQQDFIDFVGALAKEFPSVSVLLHWAKGLVAEESVKDGPKIKISYARFCDIFPDLDEDTRYVILPGAW